MPWHITNEQNAKLGRKSDARSRISYTATYPARRWISSSVCFQSLSNIPFFFISTKSCCTLGPANIFTM